MLFESKKEFLLAFSIAVAAASFSLLPTIYAWLNTPEGYWFSGYASWLYNYDINTYFTTIRQGFNGSWLWRNLYTSQPGGAYPLFTFYLFLGHLARIFHLSIPLVFHLSSFFLSIVFLLILYKFISVFFKDARRRMFCFLLTVFGGGLGFLSPLHFPDTIHAEMTVFLGLASPHWVLDGIFFLLTVLFGFLGVSKRAHKWSILAGLTGAFLATIHPYMLFVVGVVLGGYAALSGFLRKDIFSRVKYLLPLQIVGVAAFAFYYNLLFRDPLLKEWMRQQIIPSPPLPALLLSYGLLSFFAIFGLFVCWREKSDKKILLFSWLLLQLGAIYLPIQFQLVMLKNFFIILSLMAMVGLKEFSLSKKILVVIVTSFFLAQPLILLLRFALADPWNDRVYLPVEVKTAFSWLERNSFEDSLILSSYSASNRLPVWTGRRVFIGYAHWTPDFLGKYNKTRNFFRGGVAGQEETDFLRANDIDYIFYGPVEQNAGGPRFEERPELYEKVYENEKVKIFKVL